MSTAPVKPDASFLAAARKAGFEPIPLHRWDASRDGRRLGKAPCDAGWPTKDYSDFDAAEHLAAGGNIGLRPRPGYVVLDVDPRHGGDLGLYALEMDFPEIERAPRTRTGSGGVHIFLRVPDDLAIAPVLRGYGGGIEIKRPGQQVVAPGSRHPDTGNYYVTEIPFSGPPPMVPDGLLSHMTLTPRERGEGVEPGKLDADELAKGLEYLNPWAFRAYEEFFKVIAAAHHATNGDAEAMAVFCDWAAGDPEYADSTPQNEAMWLCLNLERDGAGVYTYKTLFKLIAETGKAGARFVAAVDRPSAAADFAAEPIDSEWQADEGTRESPNGDSKKPHFVFTPFVFRDPRLIPPRDWMKKPAYIRKFATGTVALGAVGKSSLLTVEAIELATGRNLLGMGTPKQPYRVVLWNGEDPGEDLERQVAAARIRYDIDPAEIDQRLSVLSGRDTPIKIAVPGKDGPVMVLPVVEALVAALIARKADVLIIDPSIATHTLPENDNAAMEQWAQAWNNVADHANVAVHIAFHTSKVRGRDAEATDLRGAGAALNKLRYTRVLNRMTVEEASKIGIAPRLAGLHIRVDDTGKSNLVPPSEAATWLRLETVDLENRDIRRDGLDAESDHVGVMTKWDYPDQSLNVSNAQIKEIFAAMAGKVWRKTLTTTPEDWVGIPIAGTLGLDAENEADKARLRKLIAMWANASVLAEGEGRDRKRNRFTGYVAGELPEAADEDDAD